MSLIRHIMPTSRRGKFIVALGVLCAALFAGGLLYVTRLQQAGYETYVSLAQAHREAALLPGAPNNPIRQELNRELLLVLSPSLSASERLQHAQDGMRLLALAEQQIDEIGEAGAKVDTLVAKMQVESLTGFAQGGMTWEMITLAKRRSAIIADIRGLSYRANFEAKKILDRVIVDDGQLTATHVTALNEAIPEMEEQFDRRSNLYAELEKIDAQMAEQSAALRWF